jgi:hypothetical protein
MFVISCVSARRLSKRPERHLPLTNKSNPTKIKWAIENAASERIDRKRTTKSDRMIQLLKARSGCDIVALSGQPHTTRAVLSRFRKAGYAIENLPPNKH